MKRLIPLLLFMFTGCLSEVSDKLPYYGELVEKDLYGHADLLSKTQVSHIEDNTIQFEWSQGDYIWAEGIQSDPIEAGGPYVDFHFTQIPASDSYRIFYNLTGIDNQAYIPEIQTQNAAYQLNLGKNGNFGYATSNKDAFVLNHANSFIWFDLYSPDLETRLTSIHIQADSKDISLSGRSRFIGDAFTEIEGSNNVTLSFEGDGVRLPAESSSEQVFAAAVIFPVDCSTSSVHIIYEFADGSQYTEFKKGIRFEAGRTYCVSTEISKDSPTQVTVLSEDGIKPIYTYFGQEKHFNLAFSGWSGEIGKIETAAPEGWDLSIDIEAQQLKVTAPAQYTPGMDLNQRLRILVDNTEVLSEEIYLVDFSHIEGTYVILEGNMTSENGSIAFFDPYGRYHKNFYESINGSEIGNVVQDLYIANDQIYFITQNGKVSFDGSAGGGDGRFIICDAHTLQRKVKRDLPFYDAHGHAKGECWPQHIVVVSPEKAYIQYSVPMESHSGIRSLNLKNNTISAQDIPDTYGEFTITGATKARMIYSRGLVYAGRGESLIIIDPERDQVIKSFSYPKRQCKDLIKGYDGKIYAIFTGVISGNAGMQGEVDYTEEAMMISIDGQNLVSETKLPKEIELRSGTAAPSILLCASFTRPEMYFIGTQEFSAMQAVRYNYQTKTLYPNYVTPMLDEDQRAGDIIYGYMGVHPFTEELWVGKSDYTQTGIHVYDVSGDPARELRYYYHPKASPAGIDFVYRFSEEWINK